MAIEFNKAGKLNEIKVGNDLAGSKKAEKEEKALEQEQVFDNKFVKEIGEDLLTANVASAYGVKLNKVGGAKIDKEFWGDAIKDLNLKDTTLSEDTTDGIAGLSTTFAMLDMQNKMEQSPFIKALNKEFGNMI